MNTWKRLVVVYLPILAVYGALLLFGDKKPSLKTRVMDLYDLSVRNCEAGHFGQNEGCVVSQLRDNIRFYLTAELQPTVKPPGAVGSAHNSGLWIPEEACPLYDDYQYSPSGESAVSVGVHCYRIMPHLVLLHPNGVQ